MKPKVSTGYLTPQVKKTKSSAKHRLSDSEETEERKAAGFNDDLFETLMKCPEKKKLILQLLAANKEIIGKELERERGKSIGSPIDKLKTKRKICESPTALLRRRALEQMSPSPSTSNRSGSSGPGSVSSDVSSHNASPIPFEKVLNGVIAYVEIKSTNNVDRSGGAKAVLKSMGAEVRETFTKDVTHVVFKDGSYTTFRKAKLLDLHLVSILWVEFSRKTASKQNEKHYPAMRCGFEDETMICSQMQKEYEDIIREEYKRSIRQGTPLPTTKSFIDRRRTLMTPSISNLNSSSSSYRTATETSSIEEILDKEVSSINGFQHSQNVLDQDVILNDPECFSEVTGPVVNGSVVEKQKNLSNIECSDMELTHVPSKSVFNSYMELTTIPEPCNNTSKRNSKTLVRKQTPEIGSSKMPDKRKTICNSLLSSDSITRSLISSDRSTKVSSLTSSKSTNVSGAIPKVTSRRLTRGSSSSLLGSESFVFGKNTAKSSKMLITDVNKTAAAMSELKLSLGYNNSKSSDAGDSVQKSTSMSSLQVSSESKKGSSISTNLKFTSKDLLVDSSKALENRVSNSKNSIKSSMSVLQISSERISTHHKKSEPKKNKGKENEDSFKSDSSSASAKPIVENIIRALQTPEFITIRKKQVTSTSPQSTIASDDSEILSPTKSIKKRVNRRIIEDEGSNLPENSNPKKTLIVNVVRSPLSNLEIDNGNRNDVNKSQKHSNKVRKLYNPDASIHIEVDDERERVEKRNQTKKRKSDEGLVVHLADILLTGSKTPPQEIVSESNVTPPKRTKKGKNKKDELAAPLNSSADEQKELLNEVLDKKWKEPLSKASKSQVGTPSRRKSTRVVKPRLDMTPSNRRSTLEFMSLSQLTSSKKKLKKKPEKMQLPTIVCTKLHKPDVEVFTQIVKKLGKFNTEDEVSDRTTHVVAGESKRTINMLRALARGCWIVRFDWVLQSLEEGKWLPEEDFEITDFSAAVQKCRLERQAFGDKYTIDVFESCPPIYVSIGSNPRASDLRELITTCKGKIVTIPRKAKIIVGQYMQQEDTVCVSESWVLDCITFYRKMPFKDKYRLSNKRQSLAV